MNASIIITTYNQNKILELILLSLVNQKSLYSYEIIICDDGGKEEANEVIDSFQKMYPEIEIYYLWQQDRGFRAGQARNMGLRQAKGDIVILLDGDMIPEKDFVQKHLSFHKKHKKTVLTGSRLIVDDSKLFDKNIILSSYKDLMSVLHQQSKLNTEELQYRNKWFSSAKPWMSVFSCNLSFPRKSNVRYSEKFIGWGIEDWDLSLRLYELGYTICFEKDIIAYHVDYKTVISNAFRNNNSSELVEFAINALLLIDQYPDKNLEVCALALQHYELKNNQWEWAGDKKVLRSKANAIKLLRNWLEINNLYSKYNEFFIEPNYTETIIITPKNNIDNLRIYIDFLNKRVKNNLEIIIVANSCPSTLTEYKKLAQIQARPCKIVWCRSNTVQLENLIESARKQSCSTKIICK